VVFFEILIVGASINAFAIIGIAAMPQAMLIRMRMNSK
jgi:hypothetical protein